MGIDNLGGFLQERNALEHVVAAERVLLHYGNLIGCQRSGFAKNFVGNRHLADVVQEGAARDDRDLLLGNAHGAGDGDGISGHATRVALGFRVLHVEGIAERFQGVIVGFFQIQQRQSPLLGALRDQSLEIGLVGAIFELEAPVFESAANRVE